MADANKYCDGLFRAERCPATQCETHNCKNANHLTGYLICDCGFRCETGDRDARLRHHGGLS